MGIGAAISYNGIAATIAAGVALAGGGTTAEIFNPLSAGAPCDGLPMPSIELSFAIPPLKTDLNVLVNGTNMTVEADGFGDLIVSGDLGLTNPLCNPPDLGFIVPKIATISNVLCNGIQVAIPGVKVEIAPIVDPDLMKMQTPQVNVILYY